MGDVGRGNGRHDWRNKSYEEVGWVTAVSLYGEMWDGKRPSWLTQKSAFSSHP
ncbi:MAG: hypothetical protein KC421_27700 [Anaerolineales bacterium]|nr:hypothetical protein [Anaerolineales bacterium]